MKLKAPKSRKSVFFFGIFLWDGNKQQKQMLQFCTTKLKKNHMGSHYSEANVHNYSY